MSEQVRTLRDLQRRATVQAATTRSNSEIRATRGELADVWDFLASMTGLAARLAERLDGAP